MEYKEIEHNGQPIRVIVKSADPKQVGKYRCYCSQVIKSLDTFDKHFESKSHKANTEWKEANRPDYNFNRNGKLKFLVSLK